MIVGIVVNRKCIDDILLTIGMRLFNTQCENCCIVFITTKQIMRVRNCCDVSGQLRFFKQRRQQRKEYFVKYWAVLVPVKSNVSLRLSSVLTRREKIDGTTPLKGKSTLEKVFLYFSH